MYDETLDKEGLAFGALEGPQGRASELYPSGEMNEMGAINMQLQRRWRGDGEETWDMGKAKLSPDQLVMINDWQLHLPQAREDYELIGLLIFF